MCFEKTHLNEFRGVFISYLQRNYNFGKEDCVTSGRFCQRELFERHANARDAFLR